MRIIGAEPAGDAVHEATGPVVESHPDMPHWNEAPTGQVPAILDSTTGDEPALAPPTWREEDSDWEAHEELFEPSMLSEDDRPAVGAMATDNDQVDVERQPWRFDTELSDETLIIEPDYPDPETASLHPIGAHLAPAAHDRCSRRPEAPSQIAEEPSVAAGYDPDLDEAEQADRRSRLLRRRVSRPAGAPGRRRRPLAEKSAAAASRLKPPARPSSDAGRPACEPHQPRGAQPQPHRRHRLEATCRSPSVSAWPSG